MRALLLAVTLVTLSSGEKPVDWCIDEKEYRTRHTPCPKGQEWVCLVSPYRPPITCECECKPKGGDADGGK